MQNKTRNAGGRLKISQRGKKREHNDGPLSYYSVIRLAWVCCSQKQKQTQKNQHGCVINQSKFATNEMKNEAQ